MHKLVASGMMALIGALLFGAFVLQDLRSVPRENMADVPWDLVLRYSIAMIVGGALAGIMFCGLFGRRGIIGWCLAMIGGVIASLLSGVLGSVFGLLPELLADGFSPSDVVQVGAGLFVLPLAVAEQPALLLAFFVLVGATHVLCRRARQST
jgi:energy-converting hydrogenase Eha subunit A